MSLIQQTAFEAETYLALTAEIVFFIRQLQGQLLGQKHIQQTVLGAKDYLVDSFYRPNLFYFTDLGVKSYLLESFWGRNIFRRQLWGLKPFYQTAFGGWTLFVRQLLAFCCHMICIQKENTERALSYNLVREQFANSNARHEHKHFTQAQSFMILDIHDQTSRFMIMHSHS